MSRAWFKPKIFGWGWFPISLEGWLLTLALALFVFYSITKELWFLLIIGLLFFSWIADNHSTKRILFN